MKPIPDLSGSRKGVISVALTNCVQGSESLLGKTRVLINTIEYDSELIWPIINNKQLYLYCYSLLA